MRDRRTEQYFDELTPSYSPGRYRPVLRFLRKDADGNASLLDVGCGSGNVLGLIRKKTTLRELAGLDVSRRYLDLCVANVPGCNTHEGSILDEGVVDGVGRRYRYVMVGAVLHHLVGSSRGHSRGLARQALANAWALVEPGGALIVMEPTFRPRWLMGLLFHLKRLVGKLSSRRVSLLGYWNNIGEPVVSYYSHEEMMDKLRQLGGELVVEKKKVKPMLLLWRLSGMLERADSVFILRK
jgi:SAM-dependent methyltransferase